MVQMDIDKAFCKSNTGIFHWKEIDTAFVFPCLFDFYELLLFRTFFIYIPSTYRHKTQTHIFTHAQTFFFLLYFINLQSLIMTLPSFVTWNICGVGTQAETQSVRHINKLKAYIVYIYCKLTLRYKKTFNHIFSAHFNSRQRGIVISLHKSIAFTHTLMPFRCVVLQSTDHFHLLRTGIGLNLSLDFRLEWKSPTRDCKTIGCFVGCCQEQQARR